MGGVGEHFRGHVLLFERRPPPAYDAVSGGRLLVTALVLEVARLAALTWLRPALPLWILLPLLLGLALLSIRVLAGLRLAQAGFRPWREWTTAERSYLLQVLVIANVIFPVVLAGPLVRRLDGSFAPWALGVFVPYLFFGFYQEVVYRGMVQMELSRRWGAFAAILLANVLYTFGPLHWSYFAAPGSLALPMFAAIFAIGLFFALLFERSGNLWLPAVFHAIGNAYIAGSLGPTP